MAGMPIFILLLLAVSCQTPQNSGPVTVDVAANRGWQDAGVTVRSGETITLNNVAGKIRDRETEIGGGQGAPA